jgi:hypothetical protein
MRHTELQQAVIDAEALLRETWARRKSDTDILVLADLRRDDCLPLVVAHWGMEFVADFERPLAAAGMPAFLPFLQPRQLVGALQDQGSFEQQCAAMELEGFANSGLGTPLWVVHEDGHWATIWAPPGIGVTIVRFEPEPAADRN